MIFKVDKVNMTFPCLTWVILNMILGINQDRKRGNRNNQTGNNYLHLSWTQCLTSEPCCWHTTNLSDISLHTEEKNQYPHKKLGQNKIISVRSETQIQASNLSLLSYLFPWKKEGHSAGSTEAAVGRSFADVDSALLCRHHCEDPPNNSWKLSIPFENDYNWAFW